MISCFIYSGIVKRTNPSLYQYRKLRRKEKNSVVKISILFSLNIVLSNSSIQFNSLALDQVYIICMFYSRCFDVRFLQLQPYLNFYSLERNVHFECICHWFLSLLAPCWSVWEMYHCSFVLIID